MSRTAFRLLASLLTLAACDHTRPLDPLPDQEALGPFANSLPHQLTFNRGGDADPSIAGDRIVFSRRPIPQSDADWCIGYLPLEGGTLLQSSCPDDGAANGTKEAWLQPTISPDGSRIAFVIETGSTASHNLSPTFRRLVVGPAEDPSLAEELLDLTVGLYNVQGPFGLIPANSIHRLQWLDDDTVIFIVGTQKNLSGQFCCDTLYVPLAGIRVDATSGSWEKLALGPLPPGDITVSAAGDILFTQAEDPAFDLPFLDCASEAPFCPQNDVMALGPDGATRLVAHFPGAATITRIVAGGGAVLALDELGNMYSLDLGTGQIADVVPRLPQGVFGIEDIAVDATRNLLVALLDPPTTPSNLWLLELQN